MNIAILGRYKMRKHACSLYFIALSINNLLYSTTIVVISLLGDGYQIRLSIRSLILCKLITYFGTLLSALSSYFIVLASIDRWCASSSSIQRRNFSNVRTAKWLIFSFIIFFSFLFIISFIMADIDTNDTLSCRIRDNTVFIKTYSIFQFILYSCLAPLLMLIFGCMTICNVKQYHIMTLTSTNYRRTESQLFRMLLVQVGVQILLTLPISLAGLLLSFSNMYQATINFYSIFIICRVIFQMSYTTPFFLYIISSRTFRQEFIRLLIKISLYHFHNRVHVMQNPRHLIDCK
ncbi:unnamed protein product [Rotaria sp. Silwood1]|nr:unnamed protein product [Rotaria sp. Silwood1]CAF3746993.1 unnamed protein product [Rotaria sp. Silwood1]CAF4965743.1 unnamed protein product [Rotaria sp. Silwood1]CAF5012949.1 unnamed protein product [Rotaria sp. Silwood1]CAF5032305.1 unnamed protein product [Rotaria sp. Silwood1]